MKRMTFFDRNSTLMLVVSAVALSACSQQKTTDHPQPTDLSTWDYDGDGQLSHNEFDEGVYMGWDENGDGYLQPSEFHGDDFSKFDVDDDDALEPDEWNGVFAVWDANEDDMIGEDEFLD